MGGGEGRQAKGGENRRRIRKEEAHTLHSEAFLHAMLCLAVQSGPIFCDPMDCSPPTSSGREDSPDKDTGVGCHALLPTQGSNPGLPQCRRILYHLGPQGSPLHTVV